MSRARSGQRWPESVQMMAQAIIRGLCRSDKEAARLLGVSVRTARRYRSEGIPRQRLREFTDRLQAIVEVRLGELAIWEKGIDELRRASASAALDNRGARLCRGRLDADAGSRVLPQEGGGGGPR